MATKESPKTPTLPIPSENGQQTTPEARKSTRGLDPELQAMAKIDRILSELDDDQRARVLVWLWDRNMTFDPPGAVSLLTKTPTGATP